MAEPRKIEFVEVLVPLWKNRTMIVIISVVVGLITWGLNFLLGDYYRASATLLPAPEKGKLSALGQFAEVAALAGVNIPGSEVSRLYPSIISSETVLRSVIEREYHTDAMVEPANLIRYFEIKKATPAIEMDYALKALRGVMSTSYDARTSIVTLSIVMDEPQLAADVLNATIEQLDQFMRGKQSTNAAEQVKWLELRLKQIQDSLRKAEELARDFREKNRRLADSPELLLRQDRLVRDVQVNSAVFVELKKQFELARLEEIKNMQIVNVLDPGRAPAIKIGPKRKTNAVIAFSISFLCLSGYFAGKEFYGKQVRQWLMSFTGAVKK